MEAEEDVEAYVEGLKESLSSCEGVLHRTTAPNLKALEKMDELGVKLQGVTEGILLSVGGSKDLTLCVFSFSLVLN